MAISLTEKLVILSDLIQGLSSPKGGMSGRFMNMDDSGLRGVPLIPGPQSKTEEAVPIARGDPV
ncbi:hypothetical protein N7486_002321 [Penicillium sp. IBT 16267x]|nr:hypothetical protein N7486_002321 [Penicillium sp. IBT 16267x]